MSERPGMKGSAIWSYKCRQGRPAANAKAVLLASPGADGARQGKNRTPDLGVRRPDDPLSPRGGPRLFFSASYARNAGSVLLDDFLDETGDYGTALTAAVTAADGAVVLHKTGETYLAHTTATINSTSVKPC